MGRLIIIIDTCTNLLHKNMVRKANAEESKCTDISILAASKQNFQFLVVVGKKYTRL